MPQLTGCGEHAESGIVVGLQDGEGGVARRVVDGDEFADERRIEHPVDDLLDRLLLVVARHDHRQHAVVEAVISVTGRHLTERACAGFAPVQTPESGTHHVESESEGDTDVSGIERDETDRSGESFGGGEVDGVAEADRLGAGE